MSTCPCTNKEMRTANPPAALQSHHCGTCGVLIAPDAVSGVSAIIGHAAHSCPFRRPDLEPIGYRPSAGQPVGKEAFVEVFKTVLDGLTAEQRDDIRADVRRSVQVFKRTQDSFTRSLEYAQAKKRALPTEGETATQPQLGQPAAPTDFATSKYRGV